VQGIGPYSLVPFNGPVQTLRWVMPRTFAKRTNNT
jgi:hypothetical protein